MKKIILSSLLIFTSIFSIAQTRVLYFADFISGTDQMVTALTNLGCTVTAVTTDAAFQSAIAVPADFDMAIQFAQGNVPVMASVSALANFVNLGKKGMYADWSGEASCGALVGVGFTGSTNETVVTVTDPTLAAGLAINPFTISNAGWGVFSTGLVPLTGSTVAGTFGSGDAAIVRSMSNNMLVFGYLSDATANSALYETAVTSLSTGITTGTFSGAYCPNATLSVPYTITGTFNGTNVFSAELSDAAGSFASPTVIGTLASAVAGTITATIPASPTTGAGYRIRVTSTTPAVIGTNNGTNLTISAPVATASTTAILCSGGTSTVTVAGTAGTAPYSGAGTFTAPAGTYTYTVTDAHSCASTVTGTLTEPAALISTSSSSAIACNGGTSTVTVSATGGTGSYSGTGNFMVSAGSYTYTVTDANLCASTTTGTITQPSALISSSSSSTIVCNGGSSTVTVSATGGTGSYGGTGSFTVSAGSYSYTVTDANLCASTTTGTVTEPAAITSSQLVDLCSGESVSVGTSTYTTAGAFTDVLAAANGCDSTVLTTVSITTIDLTTTTTGADIVSNSSVGTFMWLDCAAGTPIAGQTNQTYTTTANGDYAVEITVNGCVDTSACVSFTTTGLTENATDPFTVYPNPTSGNLTIGISGSSVAQLQITILDIQGKVVFVAGGKNINGTQDINLEGLNKGLYYIKISSETKQSVQKIIIQ